MICLIKEYAFPDEKKNVNFKIYLHENQDKMDS